MSEKIQIDGNSPEYEAFVAKFKAKKSSDDTFTPKNIYETVRDWAVRRYGIKPGTPIVRPFWPGGDYTKADYPKDCVVIDNPPFSICKKIVDWYNSHNIRFFIFAPGLSSLTHARDGMTTFICSGNTIVFENGASLCVGFLTNMDRDVICRTAPDLQDQLKAANDENVKHLKKKVTKYLYPKELLTIGRLQFLALHHTPFSISRNRSFHIRKLDCGTMLFGSFLISDGDALLAAERAAAERAAAERAAAERAPVHKIELSDREKKLIQELN